MPRFRLKSDGREYSTNQPAEITRLRSSRQYDEVGVDPVPTFDDQRFHPDSKSVKDVLAYLENNPLDADRVIAEEKAGQARVTIVGS